MAHFLPVSTFDTHSGGTVNEKMAVRSIPIPVRAQGAAFDRDLNLWISASSRRLGTLYRIDAGRNRSVARYNMVIGIEDLAFDDEGRLWSVSEAGAIRWRKGSTTFPLLFRIDPARLE